ncbi:MAG TPA: glycosyltransferase family A protein [Thermoanaerobaculia bacterium]|nr:glycosyltransferase family A protein [Thermoanaerobaculia bacterium]
MPGAGETFSIIMPTYRRPHTIYRAIAGIQAQTHRDWQLIVIDNAGDGNYRFLDPRIEVHVHAERTSASHARNRGLRYARGDLVTFFDDDDDMDPCYLAELAAAFRAHPGAKMVRCGMVNQHCGVDFSFATPEVCLRRQFATPTWDGLWSSEDQRYFGAIVAANGWTEEGGDIVVLRKVLCTARGERLGGRRSGHP